MTKRVMVVIGTRPETIKMAPVINALKTRDLFDVSVCFSGQHREMADHIIDFFGIDISHDLDVMSQSGGLFDLTALILQRAGKVLMDVKPDLVLVHGDTTTCFAGALAAFYAGIPIGHVEAGLRTHDLTAPFPEEANRALTARLAHYHFSPTEAARQNLQNENVGADRIWVTGNTAIDALLQTQQRLSNGDNVFAEGPIGDIVAKRRQDPDGKLIVVTGHRRENFGPNLIEICRAIRDLAQKHPNWHFVYPVHLNPNVTDPVHTSLSNIDNVHLVPPVDYVGFVWLMSNADVILTDSGGIQEEAPSLGKPVLVMRDMTERPEAVAAGTARIVGAGYAEIVASLEQLLSDTALYQRMAGAANPYGDGTAAAQIADILVSQMGNA